MAPSLLLESSGKVERANQTIKKTLGKLFQETALKWLDVLPIAL